MLANQFLVLNVIFIRGFTILYGFGIVWSKFPDIKAISNCAGNNYKLLSLLNLLCNSTQTTSIQTRDACYGCFFRAGNLPGGSTQLIMLSQCANLYLPGTFYANCAQQLQLIANSSGPTILPSATICYSGYCEFVRCVRKINSDILIESCYIENLSRYNLSLRPQRINFYTNVTACILSRTRCSAYNPISGQLQQQNLNPLYGGGGGTGAAGGTFGGGTFGGSFGGSGTSTFITQIPNYNSLQISSTGDIRIISFPANINIADQFCSKVSSLQQATYGMFLC